MLIWGSSDTKLKETYPVEMNCNACNCNNFILHGIQKYGHIWFLPLFPIDRVFFLSCQKCSGTVSFESLEQLGEPFEGMKFKTPISSYFGWIIIGVVTLIIGLGGLLSSTLDHPEEPIPYEVRYDTHNLKKNDLIILDSKEQKGYVIAKILDIQDEHYSLKFSKHLYKRKMTAENEAKIWNSVFTDDFYDSDYYELSMQQIKDHFEIKEIITRKDHSNKEKP